MEKVKNEYNGDFSRLVDIVRASIVVTDEDQLISVADALKEREVVRLKNRFKEPLFNGYCDALYNIEIDGIVCEVQLHINAIVVHKDESHTYYECFRSFFAGNVNECARRIEILEECINPDADVQTILEEILKLDNRYLIHDMCDLIYEMGDYCLAELLCRRLCELDPDNLDYKNNLACALVEQGNNAEAKMLMNSAGRTEKSCW
eukprot:13498971-Ditylum_brightwellii.AAC.1